MRTPWARATARAYLDMRQLCNTMRQVFAHFSKTYELCPRKGFKTRVCSLTYWDIILVYTVIV